MLHNLTDKELIPSKSLKIANFFKDNDLWFQLSRNTSKAFNCLDASKKRIKNGIAGIPLCEELKSLLFTSDRNTTTFFMLHCRANLNFSWNAVKNILGTTTIIQTTNDELKKNDLLHGTVNPFVFTMNGYKTIHFFDTRCISSETDDQNADTMMTNAGDLEWGIEFNPNELINFYLTHQPSSVFLHNITK